MIALIGQRCIPRQLGSLLQKSHIRYFQFAHTALVSAATSAEQRSTTSRWISGTLDKIERTSAWRTWSIGCGRRPWSLKVTLPASGERAFAAAVAGGERVTWLLFLQVASLRASSCRDTWSTSSCRSSLWSTDTSSCARVTPTWRGAWSRTRPRWTRLPRRCCTSPERRDCSRPRDASPSRRGSTSSSRRSGCELCVPAHQRGRRLRSDPHTLPDRSGFGVKGRSRYLSSVTPPPHTPASMRLWRTTVPSYVSCRLPFLSLLNNVCYSCPKIKFLHPRLPTPNPHHWLPRATVCVFAITTGHMLWVEA